MLASPNHEVGLPGHSRRVCATNGWWHEEHCESGGDVVLGGVPQQVATKFAGDSRKITMCRCDEAQMLAEKTQ